MKVARYFIFCELFHLEFLFILTTVVMLGSCVGLSISFINASVVNL